MKLIDLIEIVSSAYYPEEPDMVRRCFDGGGKLLPRAERRKIGDTLAEFVAVEIHDTFDGKATDEAQLKEAARVLRQATGHLQGTVDALEAKLADTLANAPTVKLDPKP